MMHDTPVYVLSYPTPVALTCCRFAEVVARLGLPPDGSLEQMFRVGFKEFAGLKSADRRDEFLQMLCQLS